nr:MULTISPECIES: ion channel [Vibrio]
MIFTISTFSVIYEMEGIVCNGELVKNTYESFYFSIVTWTTLGYGDCLPTEGIRHIAAIEALFGYIMMAIFMSLLLAVFTSRTAVGDKNT